jgi:uncharacterized protein (DUF1499 family)
MARNTSPLAKYQSNFPSRENQTSHTIHPHNLKMETDELLKEMKSHIDQMAPHQKVRKQGQLFIQAYCQLRSINNAIVHLRQQSELLANQDWSKIASDSLGYREACERQRKIDKV